MTSEARSEHRIDSAAAAVSADDVPDGVLRVLATLAGARKTLILYPLVTAVFVVLISFLFPNKYKSTVVVLPPERSFQSMELPLGELAALASGGMALPMMVTPSDILAAVLSSRTVRDSIVSRMDLARRWETDPVKASEYLKTICRTKVMPTGIIEVSVVYPDRYFTDTLVNAIVAEADRINRIIVNTKARRTREFVQGRLDDTRRELDAAASELEQFQNAHRSVGLEAQITALIQSAAELKARITADEIELSVLEGSLSPEHYQVQHLRSRIRETKRRLDNLQLFSVADSNGGPPAAGLASLPRLVQELAEITRRLKIAENVFVLLTQQYENAKIQEHRDIPSFSVLDRAVDGGVKVAPRRALIGLATLFVGFVLAAIVVLVQEYDRQLAVTDPVRHRAIHSILASLKGRAARPKTPRTP